MTHDDVLDTGGGDAAAALCSPERASSFVMGPSSPHRVPTRIVVPTDGRDHDVRRALARPARDCADQA
jgi:hypothetical protein